MSFIFSKYFARCHGYRRWYLVLFIHYFSLYGSTACPGCQTLGPAGTSPRRCARSYPPPLPLIAMMTEATISEWKAFLPASRAREKHPGEPGRGPGRASERTVSGQGRVATGRIKKGEESAKTVGPRIALAPPCAVAASAVPALDTGGTCVCGLSALTFRWVRRSGSPTRSRSRRSCARWGSPTGSAGQTRCGCCAHQCGSRR